MLSAWEGRRSSGAAVIGQDTLRCPADPPCRVRHCEMGHAQLSQYSGALGFPYNRCN